MLKRLVNFRRDFKKLLLDMNTICIITTTEKNTQRTRLNNLLQNKQVKYKMEESLCKIITKKNND